MKTPEEIKNVLECCYGDDEKRLCDKCLNSVKIEGCSEIMCIDFDSAGKDALAYIKQLEEREWELLDQISSTWHGKQYYFKQEDGTVYSRESCQYLTFDQAIDEFANVLTKASEVE